MLIILQWSYSPFLIKHSYNRTLNHTGRSHDVAEQHNVERVEQAIQTIRQITQTRNFC